MTKILLNRVGALTSKVFAFKARPWETTYTKSLDLGDNLGCPLSVETKGNQILRVLPRYNKHLKLEWCSDKARYFHERNSAHRLTQASTKNEYGRFQKLWGLSDQKRVVSAILSHADSLSVVVGRNLDIENLWKAKAYGRFLGADCNNEFKSSFCQSFASTYASIKKLDDLESAKSLVFCGIHPRWEAPISNLLFRFRYLNGNFQVSSLGKAVDVTYPTFNFGSSLNLIKKICISNFKRSQKSEKNALFCTGDALNRRKDGRSLQFMGIFSQKNGYSTSVLLSSRANTVGLAHLGYKKWIPRKSVCTYFFGLDKSRSVAKGRWRSHFCESPHLQKSIRRADYLQPMQTYLEKNGSYMRYDGVLQLAQKAVNFGFPALRPLQYVVSSFSSFGFFSKYRKAAKAKFFYNIYTKLKFENAVQKWKKTKVHLRLLKGVYGNMYMYLSVLKTTHTFLLLAKHMTKTYTSFLFV